MDATQPEAPETRLERLTSLRDIQQGTLTSGDIPARELAAISREYRATLAEIAELEPKKAEGDGIDEIAQRRAARRSSPAEGKSSAKRSS